MATGDGSWSGAESAAVDEALGSLGVAMLAAGYAVTDAGDVLGRLATMSGRPAWSVGAIPSAVLVDDEGRQGARIAGMAPGTTLRFDQVQRVGMIAADAVAGLLTPSQVVGRVRAASAMPDRYPVWGFVVGNGLVAAGVSMVFRTSWLAVGLDVVLGLLVGTILVGAQRLPRLAGLLPFGLGLLSATVVFGVGQWWGLGQAPLFAVFAPIVVLVPGATITNAVIELAAGDVISGGGRLVAGLVTWATMLVGVLSGAALVGYPPTAAATAPSGGFPGWTAWVGLVVMGVGIALSGSAGAGLGAVLTLVLLGTYALLVLIGAWSNLVVASGVTAAIVLVATRLLERRRHELPAIVTFRPAFWLLVPGSMGLAALTNLAGPTPTTTLILTVAETVLAISIGVQVGAAISEALAGRSAPEESGA